MNNVVLIGRLTRDPELRYIAGSGTAVTRFSLAIDKQLSKEKKAEMESRGQPTADFINIVVWGRQAETSANYLAKGRLVAIQGRLQSGSYDDKDGKRVYTTDVVANSVQFLEWGDDNRTQNQGYNQNQNRNQNQNQNQNDDFSFDSSFDLADNDDVIPF